MGKEEYFGNNINTNGLDKNPDNINKDGRPKKIYTILKEKGFCSDDIKTAFGEISWYDEKELRGVRQDEKKPIIVRIIANQLMYALGNNDWNKIREIIEHLIGKPNQPLEHKGEINLSDVRNKLIEKLKNAARDTGTNKKS